MEKSISPTHELTKELTFETFREAIEFMLKLFPEIRNLDNPRIQLRYFNKARISLIFSPEDKRFSNYLFHSEEICVL